MSKVPTSTIKYVIHAKIEALGVVERPDVVGAIFGQTEGMLGDELDLRELQKTGRIGRIKVTINSKGGKSNGWIYLPSSLDKESTAAIAAALEEIERIGPCEATIKITKIEDIRSSRRKTIVSRAVEILENSYQDSSSNSLKIINEVKKAMRAKEISKYGESNSPAGPNLEGSDTVIVVEGRADIVNLLKAGIKNTIAVEGTSVPKPIAELTKQRTAIAFLDGDRGGDLILRELAQVADIDYVARAPEGKEVEYISNRELIRCLSNKVPFDQAMKELEKRKEQIEQQTSHKSPKEMASELSRFPKKLIDGLKNSGKAYFLDGGNKILKKVKVKSLKDELKKYEDEFEALILDGNITQNLIDLAQNKKVKYLVGNRTYNIVKRPEDIKILTLVNQKK